MNRQHAHNLVSSGRANSVFVSVYATQYAFFKSTFIFKDASQFVVWPTHPAPFVHSAGKLAANLHRCAA